MRLRPYQDEALAAWERKVAGDAWPAARGIVAHATGLGKTVLAAAWIAELRRRAAPATVLFLAHRDELIAQAVTRLGDWIDPTDIGVVKAERHEADRPVIVGSVQSVVRRLTTIPRPDICVVDECHHAEATTYQKILDWLGPGIPVLGLSATPHRADGKPFDMTWPSGIVHTISLRQGIQRGYLADLRGLRIRLSGETEWAARIRRGDFVETDLEDCFTAGNGPQIVADAIKKHAIDRPTLVFTPTVASAELTAFTCRMAGLDAQAVSGETPASTRNTYVNAFTRGRLQVLTNCAVLTEGFDAPATSCIVIARPTKSRSLYLQMLGRGTRKWPEKTDCLVLDLVGASHRHDMESVATAVGLPWDAELGETSVAESFAKGAVGTSTTTESVPLWKARPYAWVKTNVGYALGLGQDYGTLLLREHPALGWGVYQLKRGVPHAFVTRASDLETAQAEAEEIARSLDVDRLVRRDEGWRRGKPTPGQRDALGKFGLSSVASLNRGEAADALTKMITEIHWRR